MVESKPQMKHFTAVALDFPQNWVGQAHLAHRLTTAIIHYYENHYYERSVFQAQLSLLKSRYQKMKNICF